MLMMFAAYLFIMRELRALLQMFMPQRLRYLMPADMRAYAEATMRTMYALS